MAVVGVSGLIRIAALPSEVMSEAGRFARRTEESDDVDVALREAEVEGSAEESRVQNRSTARETAADRAAVAEKEDGSSCPFDLDATIKADWVMEGMLTLDVKAWGAARLKTALTPPGE
jgi:hypothetical protein